MTNAGGIEIMVVKAGSRKELISMSVGCATVQRLKHMTSGRIYIRPLQRDISLVSTGGKNVTSHCTIHITKC